MGALGRHPRLAAAAAYTALGAAATWPLLARFGSEAGGAGAWRALWTSWWWRDALRRGASPLACDVLRWPASASLWAEPGDLPRALALWPLWPAAPAVPEVALHNLALLAALPLAAFTASLLARELWGGQLAPFLAGAVYAVAIAQLGAGPEGADLAGLAWPPLFLLGLGRAVRLHGPGGPLLAAAALALAAASSLRSLAPCALAAAVLLAAWARAFGPELTSGAFARRAALLAVAFAAFAGWLCLGALRAWRDAGWPAAQGVAAAPLSALLPGAGSWWGRLAFAGFAGGAGPFTGVVALGLAAFAAARSRAARPWAALALAAAALACVPGQERLGPFAPGPGRLAALSALGLATAAGAALAELARAGRRGVLLACGLAALAAAEAWPRRLPTASWPAPRYLRDLSRDAERWAVLDATEPDRRLWHQVLHGHPQLAGELPSTGAPPAPAPALRPFFERITEPARAGEAGPRDAVRALQALGVRFVIVDADRLEPARALGVPLAYEGEGLSIFEVPPFEVPPFEVPPR